METIRKAFVNENAIKNFREQARLAAAKERVVHAALNEAANQLVRVAGANFSLDVAKDTLSEIRPDVFTGRVEAQLSMETGAGLKRIAYPIEVRASVAVLPEDAEVKSTVEAALENTKSDLDKQIEEKAARFDNNIAEVEKAAEADAEITSIMEEQDMTRDAAIMSVFNKTAGKDTEFTVAGPGLADDANIGINAQPQMFIKIAKANLPTYAVGDPLDICGTQYVCVKVGDIDYEFQLQVL